MKKVKKLMALVIGLLLMPKVICAGSISVTGSNQVVVGNNIKVTVKLSNDCNAWQADLSFDKNYLQLVSTSNKDNGTYMVDNSDDLKSRTYTYTFKALKSGNTTVKISSYTVYHSPDDSSPMSISAGSKSIKIITQEELEASYSKDNNLKALSVEGYEISPAFNKDTTEYSVTVPEGTEKVNVLATANDSRSSVSGTGEREVTEGANNIEVVVKAENGSEKKYKITVNVIDESPIKVTVNGIEYNVVKLRSNYPCKELYEEKTVTINEVEVPACFNKASNTVLVGLKDADGNVKDFVYDNGKYSEYREVIGTSVRIIILNYDNELKGYKKEEVTINDNKYNAFKYSDNSPLYIVYGVNIENGKKDFYIYDSNNNTFTLYDKEFVDDLVNKNNMYLYIMIAFGGCFFLSLVCLLIVNSKKNKLKKKLFPTNRKEENSSNVEYTNEVEEESTSVDTDINEIEDNTEIYNLLENDKKTKKKRKK